ncbi:MAG: oxidoreductase [Hyphomicrobiales bacterium]|nr:oxidoreductase [Hyphomicrobiales bacterium]
MSKWNLIIDVADCHNCNNCFLVCKDEYVGNDIKGYCAPQPLHGHKWINILAKERGQYPMVETTYLPTMCNHCDDAPCVKAGDGAVEKRSDGIVIINPDKAIGRQDIVESCPYGAIWWNDELSLPQAWTFDAHLLDRGWKEPRCVQSCPTGAMNAIKISDEMMAVLASAEKLEPIRNDLDTKPRVYYKNLHRFTKLFVAGEVLGTAGGVTDCVAGARVELRSAETELSVTRTDPFGEFKIDGMDPDCGACTIKISHDNFPTKSIKIQIKGDSVIVKTVILKGKS